MNIEITQKFFNQKRLIQKIKALILQIKTEYFKTSDAEIDFYRQTGHKVTKMYYESRIDSRSKREMFSDPMFSMSSYPTVCWGFDFSLIFNF